MGEMAKLVDAAEYNELVECVHIEKKVLCRNDERLSQHFHTVVLEGSTPSSAVYSGIEQRKLTSLINWRSLVRIQFPLQIYTLLNTSMNNNFIGDNKFGEIWFCLFMV